MEEKTLEVRESIALIERMIRSTRRRMERDTGRPLLVWGYTTVGIALLNYGLRIAGAPIEWSFSWFLIPVLGVLLLRLFPGERSAGPRTDIDRIVSAVWNTAALSLVPLLVLCLLGSSDHYALIVLLFAVASVTTGRIIGSRVYTTAGLAGMLFSMLVPFCALWLRAFGLTNPWLVYCNIPLFAAAFVCMMIIPGHVLNRRAKHAEKPMHS